MGINYNFDESVTVRCKLPSGERFRWNDTSLFGASMAALIKAAGMRDYTLVAVAPGNDLFFVRRDLVCKGTEVDQEHFRRFTGSSLHTPASPDEVAKWNVEF